MKLEADSVRRFSHISPIYNWIYPGAGACRPAKYSGRIASLIPRASVSPCHARALYLHVPFCETICTFCPLVKGPLTQHAAIEAYVDALIAEISLKGCDPGLNRLPIRAIFFGGGTPSLLPPAQVVRIGKALRAAFNLDAVEEFSVEMELKSIASETVAAFKDIGVTHARFGMQTFSKRHRDAFNLTATLDDLHRALPLLNLWFPHVSCDMLYGLNGQTADEFLLDVESALSLGLRNLDFYPLNVFVTQKKLHRYYLEHAMPPISGMTKLYMGRVLRELMRSRGYLPHNGHGYAKVEEEELTRNPVVTRDYEFKYHQHVYGPDTAEYIGLGNSAQSYIAGVTVSNDPSRERYVKNLIETKSCNVSVIQHAPHLNAAKAIAIALPYLGHVPTSDIRWNDLSDETNERLNEAIRYGLIESVSNELQLTLEGWMWYVNLMYYLSPKEERAMIASLMLRGQEGRLERAGTDFVTAAV
jgi:anaerobilin synthase